MSEKMKMVEVRKFNSEGLRAFETWLNGEKGSTQPARSPPYELLNDDDFSCEIALSNHTNEPKRIDINQEFENKLDFSDHLCSFIKSEEDVANVVNDKFAGAWLALAYFEKICVKKPNGKWNIGELVRYIPDNSSYQKFYRHLICSNIAIYSLHLKGGRLLLSGPTHEGGDFKEQLASRAEVLVNKSLMETLDKLYWNEAKNEPKVGALDQTKPYSNGCLRRFVGPGSFYDMYYSTYDFWSMSSEQIIQLLPSEFDEWLQDQ